MRRARFLAGLAALWVAGAGACAEVAAPDIDPAPPADLRLAVTGAAADSMDATGRFRIDATTTVGGDSIISAARATQLVTAYLARRPFTIDVWTRGEVRVSLASSALAPCAPVRLFPASYAPLGDTVTFATRWIYGPWYWVPLCDAQGRRRGRTGVAALATSAGLTDSTLTRRLDLYQGIVSEGLIAGLEQVASAEDAARIAWARTGRRVSEVPRPWPRLDGWIWLSAWEVTLEDSVRVLAAGADGPVATRRLVVGNSVEAGAVLYLPSSVAPYPATVRVYDVPLLAGDPVRPLDLPLVPDARQPLARVQVVR
jgi:hypothetical protein